MERPCFLVALLEGFQLIGIYYQIDINGNFIIYTSTYEVLIAKELFYDIDCWYDTWVFFSNMSKVFERSIWQIPKK